MSETKTYSHSEIHRYLQHKMSAGEMHAIEKAMMDDPFLADAIDGYRQGDERVSAKHLNEIEQTIKGEKEKAKVIAMPYTKGVWWRVAAVVLVIFTCAMSYIILNNYAVNSEKQITSAKQSEAASNDSSATTNITSSTDNNKVALQDQALAERDANEQNRSAQKQKAEQHNTANNNPPALAMRESKQEAEASASTMHAPIRDGYDQQKSEDLKDRSTAPLAQASPAPPASRDMASSTDAMSALKKSAPTNINESLSGRVAGVQTDQIRVRRLTTNGKGLAQKEFKGTVTNPSGKPVPYATVRLNTNAATTTDANGNFNIRSADTATEVTVTSIGFESTTARLNSTTAKIVLLPSAASLSDVVVTGYGTQKRKNVTGSVSTVERDTSARIANITSLPGSPEPIGGWENFDAYAKKSIAKYKDSTNASPYDKEDVTLEFSIDKKGKPIDITIIRTGTRSDALNAISILKKGPLWKNTVKGARMVYTFKFR